MGLFVFVVALPACSRFNKGLVASDRLLVSSSSSNVVKIYGIDTTSGALSFQKSISITSPTLIAPHPTSGAFIVHKNTASLECYQYSFRYGTGPTLATSTPVASLTALMITADGTTVTYGKSGIGKIFWRTLSDCTLGTEDSLTLTGLSDITSLHQPDDGSFVWVVGTGGMRKLAKNSTSGGFTLSGSTANTSNAVGEALTPDGKYFVYVNVGSNATAMQTSDLTTSVAVTSYNVNLMQPIGNTRVVFMRTANTHSGANIASGGTLTVTSVVDLLIPDFAGGLASSPSRTFFYTGDQSSNAVWLHTVVGTSPYVTVSSISVSVPPDGLAYLSGYVAL